jgi:acetate kinase
MNADVLDDALVVNAGSTSIKLTRCRDGRSCAVPGELADALNDPHPPAAVVHRVVHGGDRAGCARLDDEVLAQLRALTELAPLHQPAALDAIDRCRRQWPTAVQFACFDTAFHAGIPEAARTYALPPRLRARVRVYGFHGLSHAWSARQVAAAAPAAARRLLVAHLGGGQSLCGVLDGRSVVTTMGFTPLDGLVMATRSGTIDPGAVLHLARHTGEDLETVLETESGLLGLAGSGDMRTVLDRRGNGDPDAELAIEVWAHRFLRQAGGCIAALGGLDALVFTGGIGEHSAEVRALVAERLSWLGVAIAGDTDEAPRGTRDITATGAPVRTLVVEAREDLQMLDEVREHLATCGQPS